MPDMYAILVIQRYLLTSVFEDLLIVSALNLLSCSYILF
jgi:hypothetical protein